MQAFWTAFAQFFATLTTLFSAAEKVAITVDNIASVGVIKSATYMQEAEHDQAVAVEEFSFNRDARRSALDEKRKALGTKAAGKTKQLAAP